MSLRFAFGRSFLWLCLLSRLLVLFLLKLLFVFFWFFFFSWLILLQIGLFILLGSSFIIIVFALAFGFTLWLGFAFWFGLWLGLFSINISLLLFVSLFFLFCLDLLFDLSFHFNFILLISLGLFLSISFLFSSSFFFLLCERHVTSEITGGPSFIGGKAFLGWCSLVGGKINGEGSLVSVFLLFGFLGSLLVCSSSLFLLTSNLGIINSLGTGNFCFTCLDFGFIFSCTLSLFQFLSSCFLFNWACCCSGGSFLFIEYLFICCSFFTSCLIFLCFQIFVCKRSNHCFTLFFFVSFSTEYSLSFVSHQISLSFSSIRCNLFLGGNFSILSILSSLDCSLFDSSSLSFNSSCLNLISFSLFNWVNWLCLSF